MSALREWNSWVDRHINVKSVYRRLQVAARFLVVGTFADDSIRVTFDYSGQVSTMQSVGCGLPLASILPAVFIMTQGISVFLIISEFAPELGCVALLVWTGLHPFIYKQESKPARRARARDRERDRDGDRARARAGARTIVTSVEQESNLEFLLESVTIMGGLMVLLSSERQNRKARPPPVANGAASLEAHGGSLEHIGLQGRRSSICSKHGARQSAPQAKQRLEVPFASIDPGETADEANKMNLLQLCGPGWHTLPPETYHRTSLRRARRARLAGRQAVRGLRVVAARGVAVARHCSSAVSL